MSETRIFFVVRNDNPDSEPVVVAEIYRGTALANLVAEHVMTIEGAVIRMHDLQAAIIDAEAKRRPRRPPMHCTTCGSTSHNVDSCPDEVAVYAVKVDGENYQHVAATREDLDAKLTDFEDSRDLSFNQCMYCGSFNKTGQPVGYDLVEPFILRCQSCGHRYPISLQRSKEVCF